MASNRRFNDGHPTYKSRIPHFFKIIPPCAFPNRKLEIPPKFVKFYGKNLSNFVVLELPDGKQWNLELTRSGGKVWFKNGWPEFAEFYSVRVGYFLLFRYEDSKLYTVICDTTNSEIEYHGPQLIVPKAEPTDDVVYPARRDLPLTNKRKLPMARAEIASALEIADGFKSINPFFQILVRQSHVQREYRVVVPANPGNFGFTNKYGEVIFAVSNGRTWKCKYSLNKGGYYRICRGWRNFVKENDVNIGDVCVFERIKSNEFSFKVFIFKATGDAHFELQQAHTRCQKVEDSHERSSSSMVHRALEEVEEFTSDYPFFVATMTKTPVQYQFLNVPGPFNSHMKQGPMKLRVGDGQWSARVHKYRTGMIIRNGWREFAKENSLQVGDICVFELVNSVDIEMEVHIFRH